MEIEEHPVPHFEAGRRGLRPRGIVVHTTAGSFDSALDWFRRPESAVSAHYLVGLDGRVARLVAEENTAHHAGRLRDPTSPLAEVLENPNAETVGIEFEDGGDPAGVRRPEAQYRAGAELLRKVAARWSIPLDRAHVTGHRELFADKTCPGNLDVDRLLALAAAAEDDRLPRPGRVVCLLPARNAEDDLPGWLESVARVADAVVALDDGSTDATGELLAGSPLVDRLLTNPRRASYAGWDDAANRNRLLEAAGELEPEWIVSLDADERIDADDAEALRRFVAEDAIPVCAYGLKHFRMWGGDRFDPRWSWVFRLFGWRAGQRFPDQRLHFNPVPTDIPQAAWIRTTVRLRHLGAHSEERLEQRLAKYRQADPDRSWPTDFGRLSSRPAGELPRWGPRPADLPVLVPPGGDVVRGEDAAGRRPRLVVLLPARNAEHDLPDWFVSVRRFADAVVALDDGSTDATAEILRAEPLVAALLANRRRESYRGWDDAGNRNRLLQAADALRPDWILCLDADERLDPGDAAALRAFVDAGAPRDLAYGFRVFRMVDDLDHWDQSRLWVYRLFAYAPGLHFPDQRLHFVPIPTAIDSRRFVKTTLRIQHTGGMTEGRRRARFAKYLEADPENDFQRDYGNLLEGPAQVHAWEPRPDALPVLPDEEARRTGAARPPHAGDPEVDLDLNAPVLSAVVISRNDEDRIEGVVRAVVGQEAPEPFEVIVVTSGTDRTAEIVRGQFPGVRVVELDRPALPGAARNAGLRVARGEFVSFPGSHVELPPGSLAARIRAHQSGHPMVTGTTLNGTYTRAGWATYFLDHSSVLPGRPSTRLGGPPAHCSYFREHLQLVGGFPEDMRAGEDTVVNVALSRRGLAAYRAQDVTIVHRSRASTLPKLLRHHFQRGRGMGRILLDEHGPRGRVLRRVIRPFGVDYLGHRVGAVSKNVARWGGELHREYRRAYPYVVLGAMAALAGTWAELLRPARGKGRLLLGRPAPRPAPIPRARRGERFPQPVDVNAYVFARSFRHGGTAELSGVAERLTYASVFAYRLNAEGGLEAPPTTPVVEAVREGGASPLLVLANEGPEGFVPEPVTALLHSEARQRRLLDDVLGLIREHGFAGLSVDFERLRPEDRDAYSAFLHRAAERLKPERLLLASALAPKSHGGERGHWHEAHDYRAHGEACDLVALMTYEWGRAGGPPRPVAPIDRVAEVVRYAVRQIPREKILLGVPLYGYDWTLPHGDGGLRARTVSPSAARALAGRPDAVVEYDERAESPSVRYRDDEGREHLAWFEDARSFTAKLDLVRSFGLRGVSLWRLPVDFPEAWRALEDAFALRRHEQVAPAADGAPVGA